MRISRTRFLVLSSLLLCLSACAPVYPGLKKVPGSFERLETFRPQFSSALYKAAINVTGKYLSGILLVKKMPDSSTRLLFSNEMGFKFFDFEFSKDGNFRVLYILNKMNRKPVIKTLRKDFELVLMQSLDTANAVIKTDGNSVYYVFPHGKAAYYYIPAPDSGLIRMVRASKRKAVVTAIAENYEDHLPDTIGITHQNFDFTISLKKINR